MVLGERGEVRLGFASQARLLLLQALGRDALVLLALGANRVGLGEVDVLALAGVAWMRLLRLPVRRRPRLRARFLLAVAGRLRGLRGLLEAQAEELVAPCGPHGELRLRTGGGKLRLTRRGPMGGAACRVSTVHCVE